MMPHIESQAQRDALIERCKKYLALHERRGFIGVAENQCALIHAIALTALEAEPEGWQFLGVNGKWLGLIDDYGRQQAEREGCEVRPTYTALPVPVLNPVVLGESQTFPDFPGDEWLWKPGVIKAILESGSTVAGEDNATTE